MHVVQNISKYFRCFPIRNTCISKFSLKNNFLYHLLFFVAVFLKIIVHTGFDCLLNANPLIILGNLCSHNSGNNSLSKCIMPVIKLDSSLK